MTSAKHKGLELNEDRPFQEKFWSFERGAWVVMALIMVAALAGLTGQGGPLAGASVAGPDGRIEYPRIARWEADDSLTVTLPPGAAGEATIDIGPAFSDIFGISDVRPTPAESSATGDGQRMTFDLGDGAGPRRIVLHVRPTKPSFGKPIEMRLNGGPPMTLTPVVLP